MAKKDAPPVRKKRRKRAPGGWKTSATKISGGESYSPDEVDHYNSPLAAEIASYLPTGCRLHLLDDIVWFEIAPTWWRRVFADASSHRFVTDHEHIAEFLDRMRAAVPGLAVGCVRGVLGKRHLELLLAGLLHAPADAKEVVGAVDETADESPYACFTPPVANNEPNPVADGSSTRPAKVRKPLNDFVGPKAKS